MNVSVSYWMRRRKEVTASRKVYSPLKRAKSFLDRVSTWSGSDVVSDQHAIFANRTTKTDQVATVVLTRSKCDFYF